MKNRDHPNSPKQEEEEEEEEDEEDGKARCEWDFTLSALISPSHLADYSDTIAAIEFDHSHCFIATAGKARKIRIYSLSTLCGTQENHHQQNQGQQLRTRHWDHNSAGDFYLCTPAKLSSLKWRQDTSPSRVGCGDYDGVVTEYDLEQRVPVGERDDHGGRRVWSMDYSSHTPALGASGGDDGAAHLWDTRLGTSNPPVASLRPGIGIGTGTGTGTGIGTYAPVCSIEFSPACHPLIAIGSADKNVYLYDVRALGAGPLAILKGHARAVSYVRFLGEGSVVSAGVDGCLKLWDISELRVVRTFEGHSNTKNFVGLSVWRTGGLLGCGSESNEVYVYDRRWGEPVWVQGLRPDGGDWVPPPQRSGCETACGHEPSGCQRARGHEPSGCQRARGAGFVSSVCWRQTRDEEYCTLVVGASYGVLQVFTGNKRLA
ncbi:hypothetical protein AMTRI_Chr07g81560 [Amborella trichopoda]